MSDTVLVSGANGRTGRAVVTALLKRGVAVSAFIRKPEQADGLKALGATSIAIGAAIMVLMALSGMTYGPVAALLTEMFPPHIRYSSMSIPYHIGTGYFGGFLPLIAAYIVAKTGDPFAGIWYAWVVTAVAFVVALWGLKSGPPRDFEQDAT